MKLILLCILLFPLEVFCQADSLHQDEPGKSDICGPRVGYWKIYGRNRPGKGYPDSVLIEEGAFDESGRKTGLWKFYHPNGKLKLEAEFVNGRPVGTFSRPYPSDDYSLPGALRGRVYFEDTINCVDENGKKQGLWIVFGHMLPEKGFPRDSIIRQGYYENNRKVGIWFYHYPNGIVKTEANFVNGKPNGIYCKYYNTGILKETGELKAGRIIGPRIQFYDNGCMKRIEKYYKSGKANSIELYSDSICDLLLKKEIIQPFTSIRRTEVKCDFGGRSNSKISIFNWYGYPIPINHDLKDSLHFISKKQLYSVSELSEKERLEIMSCTKGIGGDSAYIDFKNPRKRKNKWIYTYYVFKWYE